VQRPVRSREPRRIAVLSRTQHSLERGNPFFLNKLPSQDIAYGGDLSLANGSLEKANHVVSSGVEIRGTPNTVLQINFCRKPKNVSRLSGRRDSKANVGMVAAHKSNVRARAEHPHDRLG
jgi:hypothetical protein